MLGIIFILFVSMFSLDVFGEGYTLTQTLVALFMHLIPSFLLLAVFLVAWRFERTGGVLFILLGLWYIAMTLMNSRFSLSASVIIAGPAVMIGLLFIADGIRISRTSRKSV